MLFGTAQASLLHCHLGFTNRVPLCRGKRSSHHLNLDKIEASITTSDEDGIFSRTHCYCRVLSLNGAPCTGGKWTTYRLMAQDGINAALKTGKLPVAGPCITHDLHLMGANGYTPALFTEVAQNYTVPHRPGAIDTHVAQHLAGALSSSCFLAGMLQRTCKVLASFYCYILVCFCSLVQNNTAQLGQSI